MVAWSVDALGHAEGIEALLCVLPPATELPDARRLGAERAAAKWLTPVAGGETRQASLAQGLQGLETCWPEGEWVLVHDAARCMVEPLDAERVLAAASETGAAIPVLPVVDTLKEVREGVVVRTLARSSLARVQTPQAFRLPLLREALEKASREGFLGSDCASLVERLGIRVRTCPGREGNWKVTGPLDLERAAAVLSRPRSQAGEARPGLAGSEVG